MLLIETELRTSSIQGLGVFTLTAIPASSIIWQLNPAIDLILPGTELGTLPVPMRRFVERYGYRPHRFPNLFVLECDNGKFMNHSPAPNVDFSAFDVAFALRDISPGEELTTNYFDFDFDFDGRFDGGADQMLGAPMAYANAGEGRMRDEHIHFLPPVR